MLLGRRALPFDHPDALESMMRFMLRCSNCSLFPAGTAVQSPVPRRKLVFNLPLDKNPIEVNKDALMSLYQAASIYGIIPNEFPKSGN
jgi:hypothetical protein